MKHLHKIISRKIKIVFFVLLIGNLISCEEQKPTICDCHTAYMKNVSSNIYGGSGTSSEVKKCFKYFSEEEIIYADENHGCE